MHTTVQTQSNLHFDYKDPFSSQMCIEDIAHALSHICRFAGHTRTFYSVAQHCVNVSLIVERKYAMAGLLHDAAEAFIGDMPTPLKRLMPEYRALEHTVEAAIFHRFGVDIEDLPHIKEADTIMLITEQRDFMPLPEPSWVKQCNLKPRPGTLWGFPSEAAKFTFLQRYYELLGDTHGVC